MESAEQPDRDLQQGVQRNLEQAGHKVAPETLNPDDQSSLKSIKRLLGDTAHVVGTTYGETVGPEVNYNRGTQGTNWLRTLKQRALERLKWK